MKLARYILPFLSLGAIAYGSLAVRVQVPPPPGAPLPGLTPAQLALFNAGRDEFLNNETPAEGLGPVFNGVACAECHRQGAPGGAGVDLLVSRVTRIGGTLFGRYNDLTRFGGPVIQRRSLRELDPTYPIKPEHVPSVANFVSLRITTPLFGNGLMEAIPDATILALADPNDTNLDGISGRANMVFNPETQATEVGKFGWKSQISTLHHFSGDAYLNEMGVTSPSFTKENLPQGYPLPPGTDNVPDPEDDGEDVQKFTDFMRLLAPPLRRPGNPNPGEQLFSSVRCTNCHTPLIMSGPSNIAAIANKEVRLYSDLLLHDMGAGLNDGIIQGQATGSELRTAPLWGLSLRRFFLHDGRANTIDAAIRAHGGEATASRQLYEGLSQQNRNALLAFLGLL